MQQFCSNSEPNVETIETVLEDFGFYHTWLDVLRMYAEYSNHGHYGYAGGVLDQPQEYWDDMTTMKWLELWVKHIAGMPRLEHESVFDTLRNEGRIDGRMNANWLTYGSE